MDNVIKKKIIILMYNRFKAILIGFVLEYNFKVKYTISNFTNVIIFLSLFKISTLGVEDLRKKFTGFLYFLLVFFVLVNTTFSSPGIYF